VNGLEVFASEHVFQHLSERLNVLLVDVGFHGVHLHRVFGRGAQNLAVGIQGRPMHGLQFIQLIYRFDNGKQASPSRSRQRHRPEQGN